MRVHAQATFDGPARAVRCARSIVEQIRRLGLEVRTGLHTGECEMVGDDVRGIAVHTAARIADSRREADEGGGRPGVLARCGRVGN